RAKLPPYMVPAVFVLLGALPLTPNGKVDVAALARLEPGRDEETASYLAPRTPVEETLCEIWAGVLRRERVGIRDNFFEIGGHSLLATQVVSRIRQTLEVELPVRRLFEAPTVEQLAAELMPQLGSGVGEIADFASIAGIAGISDALGGVGDGTAVAPAAIPPLQSIPRAPRSADAELPLSFGQERLWFLDQLEPGSPLYNLSGALSLRGRLSVAALGRGIGEIVRRHKALRTVFIAAAGRPAQVIVERGWGGLPVVDLAGLRARAQEAERRRLTREEMLSPFDLQRGPLLRVLLLRRAAEEHELVVNFHHIVSDGWSIRVFVRELGALYAAFLAGRPSSLPELPMQYVDFAAWQRSWLTGEILETELGYWRERLAGAPPLLRLPADRPRPAAPRRRGASLRLSLDAELAAGLRRLALAQEASLFMVLLAGLTTLLRRISGQDDLVVGTPIANRTRAELEELIGCFVNSLALRLNTADTASFAALVAQAREVALGAYSHQSLPFEKLVEELQPERSLSYSPLFQVLLVLQNTPGVSLRLPKLSLESLELETETARVDLLLSLMEVEGGLSGELNYDRDLFDRTTMARFAAQLARLLEGAVVDPLRRLSELPLLAPAEEQQLREWNDTRASYPGLGATLPERIAGQAGRSPDAVALEFEDRFLTYAEMDARAERLAQRLRDAGIDGAGEARVGIC
ncbi:MAG TPA: condensation domain-containing protein, partial [Thermoanaerobaculia bacterium]|nr:condensation domain-containing protein [Thermoanaerobaculia bacterium]